MSVLAALFSSRKFVIALVAILALVPLVALKAMTVDQFTQIYKWVVSTIIAGIAVEGAAEKLLVAPPATARPADSIKPPPKMPSIPPVAGLMLLVLASCAGERDVVDYGAEQAQCVNAAHTREEADACRARVKAAHGRLDGGVE